MAFSSASFRNRSFALIKGVFYVDFGVLTFFFVLYFFYDFCISNGANAAISNIHLNVWYGNYNKLDMSLKILDEWNLKEHECMYIGDSPNDSPMFNHFSFSV